MAMDIEQYLPPDGAMQLSAAMRIACYCRHQSEKEGFQVIFTLKDQQGNVIAQQISDSILITDDRIAAITEDKHDLDVPSDTEEVDVNGKVRRSETGSPVRYLQESCLKK